MSGVKEIFFSCFSSRMGSTEVKEGNSKPLLRQGMGNLSDGLEMIQGLTRDEVEERVFETIERRYKDKEALVGPEVMRDTERIVMLNVIDGQWKDHLLSMDHLKEGIGLRGYGQRDPKQEYKKEGYDIFITMMAATSSSVASKLFKVQVRKETEVEQLERADLARHQQQEQQMIMRHGSEVNPGADDEGGAQRPSTRPPGQAQQRQIIEAPKRTAPKIGRNDLCPCGSGEPFKKCHGAALDDEAE